MNTSQLFAHSVDNSAYSLLEQSSSGDLIGITLLAQPPVPVRAR